MLAETTPITINIPAWFYVVCSGGVLALVFGVGINYCRLKDVCKDHPKIRRALTLISQKLLELNHFDEHVYVSHQSPMGLTDAGLKMLQESNFDEFFEANKKYFFAKLDSQEAETPFDVETATRELMLYLDLDKTAKADLIKNFSHRIGRPIVDILLAYSIAIRDKYMAEHSIPASL